MWHTTVLWSQIYSIITCTCATVLVLKMVTNLSYSWVLFLSICQATAPTPLNQSLSAFRLFVSVSGITWPPCLLLITNTWFPFLMSKSLPPASPCTFHVRPLWCRIKLCREQHAITVLSIIATLCSIGFWKILLTDSSRPKAFSERNTKITVEHSNNFQDYWRTRKQILQTQSILWQ